ncbi:MAG TPA: response regulator [Conexibacter sp.]|jgi:two-component system response regulator|nr:response regulator [Casimicrobiaceae bacterium]
MSDDAIDVLLVEDNPDDAEFTLRALRKANVALNVAHVDNGVVALDFMFGTGSYAGRGDAALPRVVLLDLKIPRVDGHEVLRRIKGDMRTRLQPVVVLTSSRERRDIEASYAAGANSYIVKPVEYGELIGTLSALVRYWLQLNERPQRHA